MIRRYKKGMERQEVARLPPRLDDYVDADNPVRAIDAYADTLDLMALGFDRTAPNQTEAGQPPFPPAELLKLYLYGYVNRVRSSRALEKECQRNLEVIWLVKGLRPGYKTIADFRKRDPKPLRQVHARFIGLCQELDLLGGRRVGVDGSHFTGNVSDKSFRSVKGLARDLEKLEKRIGEWLEGMDVADCEDLEAPARHPELSAKLEKLKALRALKETQEAELKALEAAGEAHRSVTDPDARLLNKRGNKTAGYNVQIVVDAKHRLIVADDVVRDRNDFNQLHPMLSQAKAALGVERLEGLGDKGYCNMAQLALCEADGITAYVPEPERGGRQRQGGRFTQEDFRYLPEEDAYLCPEGKRLARSGEPRFQKGSTINGYRGSETDCRRCPLRDRCIAAKTTHREIWRNEHHALREAHRRRMEASPGVMRERSALVGHPFGTLKCRAGWNHFLVRGLAKVRGEWSLMALAYNFTRALTILGLQAFRDCCAQKAACRC